MQTTTETKISLAELKRRLVPGTVLTVISAPWLVLVPGKSVAYEYTVIRASSVGLTVDWQGIAFLIGWGKGFVATVDTDTSGSTFTLHFPASSDYGDAMTVRFSMRTHAKN